MVGPSVGRWVGPEKERKFLKIHGWSVSRSVGRSVGRFRERKNKKFKQNFKNLKKNFFLGRSVGRSVGLVGQSIGWWMSSMQRMKTNFFF